MATDIKVMIKAILADKDFKKGMKGMQTSFGKTEKKSKSFFKTIKAGWLIIGVGVLAAVKGFKSLIKAAGDAQEVFSKFNTVFRDVRKEADLVAKNLARNFGLSSIKARELLSDTGDLLTGFGFTQKASLDLAKQVNELAVDLASFTNFSGGAEGASKALTKALLGERESVKSLGISILEADVNAKVLLNTQKGLIFASERQAKAYATLEIAQEQSKNAQGDFARTHKDFNNQVRILNSNLEEWAVKLGSRILPIFAPFVTALNKVLQPSRDIEDITIDLIASQTRYKEIVDKLSDSQLDLSKSERQVLQIRRDIIELDILKEVKALTEEYPKQTEKVKELKVTSDFYSKALDSLKDKIADYKDETIELTREEIRLTGVTAEMVSGFDRSGKGIAKYTDVLKFFNDTQIKSGEAIKKTDEENLKLKNSITGIANALNDEIILQSQLMGLNEELLEQIRVRREELLLEAQTKKEIVEVVEKEIVETKMTTQEEWMEFMGQQKELELAREQKKYEELIKFATKNNKDLVKLEQQHIKNIETIEKKYRETSLKEDEKMAEAKQLIAGTFVSGFLGGIEDMQSGSKTIFASMVKQFAAMISGQLGILAAKYWIQVLGGNLALIPAAVGATAAAGAVKLAGNVAAAEIMSHQEGIESVPATGLANIHAGERVISAQMNVPDVSNEDFVQAAIAGLSLPAVQGGSSNDDHRNYEDNRSFSYNNEVMEGAGMEEFLEMTEMMDTRWNRR